MSVAIGTALLGLAAQAGCHDGQDDEAIGSSSGAVTTANGMPLNGLELNGMPLNGMPYNGFLLNGFALNGMPYNGMPYNGVRVVANGMPYNGMPYNGMPLNGMPLNGMPYNGMPLNGMPYNGLTDNGMPYNGLNLNGLHVNGMPYNGMPYNGMPLNGMPLNGMPLNGLYINGLAVNGMPLNGIEANGMPLNGMPLNGMPLNGLELYGTPITVEDAETFETVLFYLVQCALTDTQSITYTRYDGVTEVTLSGELGYAPEWADGRLSDDGNARVRTCLLSVDDFDANPDFDGVEVSLVQIPLNTEDLERFRVVMEYVVKCALDETQTVDLAQGDPRWTFSGFLGLAPEWETGVPATDNLRCVSACLGALTNANGQTVRVSLRGCGLEVGPQEVDLFHHHEGGFWGDFFTPDTALNVCEVDGGISGRICSTPGACGFSHHGACSSTCDAQKVQYGNYVQGNLSGPYNECGPDSDPFVINTYMNLETSVSFGAAHNCVKTGGGTVWCWGSNGSGELGQGTTSFNEADPLPVELPADVAQISASSATSFARLADGRLFAWGSNDRGALGLSGASYLAVPTEVAALGADVSNVSSLGDTACAVQSDGDLWCWGDNTYGQLGDPAAGTSTPTPTPVLTDVASVATGYHNAWSSQAHNCAVRIDGSVWCWGTGALGTGAAQSDSPVQVTTDSSGYPFGDITEVCVREGYTAARDAFGTIWHWSGSARPSEWISGVPPGGLACGLRHTCAIKNELVTVPEIGFGTVRCWGENDMGQLGDGTTNPSTAFARRVVSEDNTGSLANVTDIFAGGAHTCARTMEDEIWCWGNNLSGQLGNPAVLDFTTTPVLNLTAMGVPQCRNSVCEAGETATTCPIDCAETCDNQDNDGDGEIDEDLTRACGTDVGSCEVGEQTCTNGVWSACVGEVGPTSELCDGEDNDCDWLKDEGLGESCELPTTCGDGLPDPGEQCDPGSGVPCCADDCTWSEGCMPVCGDGQVDPRAEQCDGGPCCNTDCTFTAMGTACGLYPGTCGLGAGTCTGWSSECPGGETTAAPAGTVCREAVGPCDVRETCDGVTTVCPGDVLAPVGTECRAANGACDVAETCTGSSAACPGNGFQAAGVICRPSTGECDVQEICSGEEATCPENGFVADGTACSPDGNECTINTCSTGVCGADPVGYGQVCSDDGIAGTLDFCDTGACTHPYGVNGDLLVGGGSESQVWSGDLITIDDGSGDVVISGDLTIAP